MRLKLVKNFNGTDHQDASRSRDQDNAYVASSQEIMDINIPAVDEDDAGQELVLSGEEEADEADGTAGPEEPTEYVYVVVVVDDDRLKGQRDTWTRTVDIVSEP